MKIILLCALVAVASSQFRNALNPAEVILQRQGNRAILRVPENFQFGDHAIQLIQGRAGAGSGSVQQSSSFQANQQQQQQRQQQQSTQFQQQGSAAFSFQQQQQQQQQQAAAAAAARAQAQYGQSQSTFQSQQSPRAPVKPSTILAGATQGALAAGPQSTLIRTSQQQTEFQQQQQQQQQEAQYQAQQQREQQQALLQAQQERKQQQIVQVQQGDYEEVQGVFEPLNLPSGASLLLGQVSTEFSCNNRPYGYYGDDTNNCQVFHICYPALFSSGVIETYQYSFMCGEGTQFDQKEMACVSYDSALPCIETQNYYVRNAEFGLPHEKSG